MPAIVMICADRSEQCVLVVYVVPSVAPTIAIVHSGTCLRFAVTLATVKPYDPSLDHRWSSEDGRTARAVHVTHKHPIHQRRTV